MDRAILISIFSFVFGVLVSSFIFLSPLISLFFLLIGVSVLVAEKIHKNKIEKQTIFLSLFLISLSFGTLRYAIKDFHEPAAPSSEGIVVSEPEQRDNATRFVFKAENGEKALVSTDLYSTVQYGDRVRIVAEFERPGMIEDFDYGKYLSKDDIYHTASFAEVEILSSGHGNVVKTALLQVKRSFVSKIRENFSEPYASLLAGLIVSGRDAMPKNILEEFRRAGIIHIVVLSGYNITIIADFLRRFFEKAFLLSKFTAIPMLASTASIAGIVLFVLMTGAEATVVRAALMVLTVIVAKMLGRHYSAPRALVLAGFVMLLENPKILVLDPSFQLSFIATLALIYIVPLVEKRLQWLTNWWNLRGIVATTIGTQVAVLPLLIYSVGDFSLVSLPANILVLLIMSQTMFVGFFTVVLSYLSSILALPLAYVTHLLLAWIIGVSSFASSLPFASIAVTNVSIWVVVLVYLALIALVWRLRNSSPSLSN